MKKNTAALFTVLVAFVAIITAFYMMHSFFGIKNVEEYEGKSLSIRWEEVNVRSEHSLDGKIISSLTKGEDVILTGVRYDDPRVLDDVSWASWIQILMPDGTEAWLVADAVQWH